MARTYTRAVSDKVLRRIARIFKDEGWTWGSEQQPPPGETEIARMIDTLVLDLEPEYDFIGSGRLLLQPDGDDEADPSVNPKDGQIYVRVGNYLA